MREQDLFAPPSSGEEATMIAESVKFFFSRPKSEKDQDAGLEYYSNEIDSQSSIAQITSLGTVEQSKELLAQVKDQLDKYHE